MTRIYRNRPTSPITPAVIMVPPNNSHFKIFEYFTPAFLQILSILALANPSSRGLQFQSFLIKTGPKIAMATRNKAIYPISPAGVCKNDLTGCQGKNPRMSAISDRQNQGKSAGKEKETLDKIKFFFDTSPAKYRF